MESALRDGASDPGLRLIETLGWDGSGFPRLRLHLARLAAGAAALGWSCDVGRAEATLRGAMGAEAARVRLTLDARGACEVTAGAMPEVLSVWRLALAEERLSSADLWLRLKSTRRGAYERAKAGLAAGTGEAIFQNERGEVCDGTITTLFFDRGQGLRTPPLTSGLLPGVLRAAMLAAGECREEVLMADDLPEVRLWAGNSLRGLAKAVWAG